MQLDGAKLTLDISDWSPRGLLDVIRHHLLPPVIEFSRDASRLIALSNVVNHVLLFTTRRSDNDASAVYAFTQTAAVFQGQVRYADHDDDDDDDDILRDDQFVFCQLGSNIHCVGGN